MEQQGFSAPNDLGDQTIVDQAFAKTQLLIQRFGALLYWWPEIVARTALLRSQGTNIGRQIV